MVARIISVTSGKGGVGKTLSTVSLAFLAQKSGKRVLIFDGDLGLSNVDVVMGLRPRFTLRDVLDGNAELADIIVEDPSGVKVISSGSGIASLNQLSIMEKTILMDQCRSISDDFDLMLIDTGAGISDNVIQLNSLAHLNLIVTTPEPHAITDAYAIIKVLSETTHKKLFHLLVNQSRSQQEALKVFERIAEVSDRFLGSKVVNVGYVPFDPEIQINVLRRSMTHHRISHTLSGQAWQRALQFIYQEPESVKKHVADDFGAFWVDLIQNHNHKFLYSK